MLNLQNSYNGWKNYQTWDVFFSLNNGGYINHLEKDEMEQIKSYKDLIEYFDLEDKFTGDGTHYLDIELDYTSLDEAIKEMMAGVA
jgi:hypothetical protein